MSQDCYHLLSPHTVWNTGLGEQCHANECGSALPVDEGQCDINFCSPSPRTTLRSLNMLYLYFAIGWHTQIMWTQNMVTWRYRDKRLKLTTDRKMSSNNELANEEVWNLWLHQKPLFHHSHHIAMDVEGLKVWNSQLKQQEASTSHQILIGWCNWGAWLWTAHIRGLCTGPYTPKNELLGRLLSFLFLLGRKHRSHLLRKGIGSSSPYLWVVRGKSLKPWLACRIRHFWPFGNVSN